MTTTPAPLNEEEHTETEEPQRPALRLVSGVDDIEVPEGVEPGAPLAYRINSQVTALAEKLPGVWSKRLPSFAEVAEHVRDGDWTLSNAARTANLLGFLLLCLPMGLFGAFLVWLSRRPPRAAVAVIFALVLAYALS